MALNVTSPTGLVWDEDNLTWRRPDGAAATLDDLKADAVAASAAPKPPSQAEQLLGIAGLAAGPALGKIAGQKIVGGIKDLFAGGDGLVGSAAENAAYNAAADAATFGSSEAATQALEAANSGGSLGGSVSAALPYLGTAAGAYGLYDALSDPKDPAMGALQGGLSGAGLGAGLGTLLGLSNPITAPVAIAGALLGGGAGFLGDEPKTEEEDKRLRALVESGVLSPDTQTNLTSQSRDEQLQDILGSGIEQGFVGVDPSRGWVNTNFLASGNESDLRPEDIWGYAAFSEEFGKDWLQSLNEEQRRQVAQSALDQGLVNEHHGTVDVNFNQGVRDLVNSLLGR